MTIDDVRQRLRRKLERDYGPEEASYLMDRPPGGWSDLVTNQVLDARLAEVRAEMREGFAALRAEMAELRGDLTANVERQLREQTWRLAGLVFVAFGLFAALARVL